MELRIYWNCYMSTWNERIVICLDNSFVCGDGIVIDTCCDWTILLLLAETKTFFSLSLFAGLFFRIARVWRCICIVMVTFNFTRGVHLLERPKYSTRHLRRESVMCSFTKRYCVCGVWCVCPVIFVTFTPTHSNFQFDFYQLSWILFVWNGNRWVPIFVGNQLSKLFC